MKKNILFFLFCFWFASYSMQKDQHSCEIKTGNKISTRYGDLFISHKIALDAKNLGITTLDKKIILLNGSLEVFGEVVVIMDKLRRIFMYDGSLEKDSPLSANGKLLMPFYNICHKAECGEARLKDKNQLEIFKKAALVGDDGMVPITVQNVICAAMSSQSIKIRHRGNDESCFRILKFPFIRGTDSFFPHLHMKVNDEEE